MKPTGQGTQRTSPCMLRYKGGSSHDGQAETPPPGVNPNGPFATRNRSPALATFPRMPGRGPNAPQRSCVSPRFIRTLLDECRLAQVGSARADRFRRPSWLTVFMDLVYHDCISRAPLGLPITWLQIYGNQISGFHPLLNTPISDPGGTKPAVKFTVTISGLFLAKALR